MNEFDLPIRIDRLEQERIDTLHALHLLDTEPTELLDNITRLASLMFKVPIALVSLVDSDRLWFKSRHGLDLGQTEREFSFCSYAIQQKEGMVVLDATRDPKFAGNLLVRGAPHIRFYAGVPLILASGHALGTLCIIDHEARCVFSKQEAMQLATLAALVVGQLESHRRAGRVNEVTRLPNRTQMADDIEARMLLDPGTTHGLMLIEVIDHQSMEDTTRAVGVKPLEATLRNVAVQLKDIAGATWPAYHVGDTRFCVNMPGGTREEREAFCLAIIDHLESPFESLGVPVQLEIVAGLVEFKMTVQESADTLRKATSALQEATTRGKKFCWYDDTLDAGHARSYQLMREISGALSRGEFRLVYQPKYNIGSGAYTGVEALARWRHPVYGEISPGEFIPLIEKTSLIHEFTHWVISKALVQVADWQRVGLYLTAAVNVSSRNLDKPGFVNSVRDLCALTQVEPKWLHVECTENAILTGEDTRAALTELRAMGTQVLLDDFGMGYSNLSCLRGLPVQVLKLDQSLVKPMENDPTAHELVKSLIQLGHSLGFSMLGEGVETSLACTMLIDAGCDAMQGYYLSRPMEPAQIPAFMRYPNVLQLDILPANER